MSFILCILYPISVKLKSAAMPNPTFEKLDRVLASVEWEQRFPFVIVQALSRGISDHTPLFLDSDEATHLGNKKSFLFELAWFEREGFFDLVPESGLRMQEVGLRLSVGRIRLGI